MEIRYKDRWVGQTQGNLFITDRKGIEIYRNLGGFGISVDVIKKLPPEVDTVLLRSYGKVKQQWKIPIHDLKSFPVRPDPQDPMDMQFHLKIEKIKKYMV
jgi:hypothetical protein